MSSVGWYGSVESNAQLQVPPASVKVQPPAPLPPSKSPFGMALTYAPWLLPGITTEPGVYVVPGVHVVTFVEASVKVDSVLEVEYIPELDTVAESPYRSVIVEPSADAVEYGLFAPEPWVVPASVDDTSKSPNS